MTKLNNFIHNCVLHPLMGLCYLLGMQKLGDWVHGSFEAPAPVPTASQLWYESGHWIIREWDDTEAEVSVIEVDDKEVHLMYPDAVIHVVSLRYFLSILDRKAAPAPEPVAEEESYW